MQFQDREQSEFNMAFNYLNRLNNLFYTADESAISLNAHQWYHTLLAIYRELIAEFKPEEEEQLKKQMFTINNLLQTTLKRNHNQASPTIPADLYAKLHDFEITLRKVLKSSGLLMKMKQDPRKALG